MRNVSAARALLTSPGRDVNQGVGDYTIIAVLLETGLRISELLGLDLDQWNGQGFTRVRIKGNRKLKTVPITAEGRKALEAWLKERGDKLGPIFTTSHGHWLGRKQFYEVVKRVER